MAHAAFTPGFSLAPRPSTETDRRYLLEPDSVAPSESASMITKDDGDWTPRARSPAPGSSRRDTIADPTTGAPSRPYRGFPSEAHYLAALHAWAESKKYLEPSETTLVGFYGQTTMSEYSNRPPMEGLGLKKKWKARKAAKQEAKQGAAATAEPESRRHTVA